jgi:hypothetical protein
MRVQLSRSRWLLIVGFLGLAALAVLWGRGRSISQATAQSPAQPFAVNNQASLTQPSSVDNSKRVVAYIYNTIPLTRSDFGEYLIERQGAERLDNFINRRIIEIACQQTGVEVTAAEVEAELATMLAGLNATPEKFEQTMLKPYHKTLYEWKEDAVRPRLLLTKLTRQRVQVTEEELQMAFEAHYGEKVDCRIIMWPKQETEKVLATVYPKIRDSEHEFDLAASHQASATLAAKGGQVEPFGRHSTGNDALENAAFSLHEGELSAVVGTPEGPVVIKCVKHLPPQKDKSLADPQIREKLSKEVFEKKLQIEIQRTFAELKAKANPKKFFSQAVTEDELKRQVSEELQPTRTGASHGN